MVKKNIYNTAQKNVNTNNVPDMDKKISGPSKC